VFLNWPRIARSAFEKLLKPYLLGRLSQTRTITALQAGTNESQSIKHFRSKQGLLVLIFNDGWSRTSQQRRIVLDQSCVDRLEVLVLVSMNAFRSDLARKMQRDQLLAARRLFT
jgi:hypothetical protein